MKINHPHHSNLQQMKQEKTKQLTVLKTPPPLILHVPHASTHIPFTDGYLDEKTTALEIQLLTDWYTDELFGNKRDTIIQANFSRVFCDVERFSQDEIEPMSAKGMGVVYTHCDDGTLLRNLTSELRGSILKGYYDPHHQRLNDVVDESVKCIGNAKIIDCHSYPDVPLMRDIDQTRPRPDFNIGIDAFHTPKTWIELSKNFFEKHGYSLGINWPYSGTMVPTKAFNSNPNVHSIMLEINRKLYLQPNHPAKNNAFDQIRSIVQDWLSLIHLN